MMIVITADQQLYITDDCPSPGQYGRGDACKTCPEGTLCPGGYRMWPSAGYWNADETSGKHRSTYDRHA